MIYFTSDLHFWHDGIIKLCNRPFESIEQMNETLINNWNSRVRNNDIVYIIGDFCWKKQYVKEIVERLKGKKILIIGNHDTWVADESLRKLFFDVKKYEEVNLNYHQITMCHYPMLEWKDSRKENESKLGYLIFGHIHNNIEPLYSFLFKTPNALNAGVDINNYVPVTFEELVANNEIFSKKALAQLKSEKN